MKQTGKWFLLGVMVTVLAFWLAGCSSLYTQASPLPSAANMAADCATHPGSVACDTYNTFTALCNGQIALPISFGSFNQNVCIGLGYGSGAKLVPAPAK